MRAAFALAYLIATTGASFADSLPVIVIPGRPGVPIIINGVDASYSVVEGDWGLGKGIHVQPTVYGGRYVDPEPHVGHYYPSSGRVPGYGRLEIEPPSNGSRGRFRRSGDRSGRRLDRCGKTAVRRCRMDRRFAGPVDSAC